MDASNKLSEYMLRGWVLTDRSCKSQDCHVPLLRSPNKTTPVIHLCVNCDTVPASGSQQPSINASDSASSITSNTYSRSSTPPTELSSTLSSPIFAPPVDTEEIRLRREQSDVASTEIGRRLLKGWTMLGEECLSEHCYGVPLVQPPKAGSGTEVEKECVVCRRTYVTELDWAGRQRLVLANQNLNITKITTGNLPEGRFRDDTRVMTPTESSSQMDIAVGTASSLYEPIQKSSMPQGKQILRLLEESSSALQSTLQVLCTRLGTLTRPESVIEPSSVGSYADAINKVTEALSRMRQLQWNEIQAGRP